MLGIKGLVNSSGFRLFGGLGTQDIFVLWAGTGEAEKWMLYTRKELKSIHIMGKPYALNPTSKSWEAFTDLQGTD